MRKFSKICESIWSDMQNRGTGEIKKKEDESNISNFKPIDLGGSVLWADRDLEVHGNDLFTVKEVQKIIKDSEWRLPTVEEAKELDGAHGYYESDGWSFGEDDNILYFTKRKYHNPGTELYIGFTSNIFFDNTRVNVFMLEDEHLNEDIIYTASVEEKYNARLVKDLPRTNESIWSDMEDRGSGVLDKKEDAVNTLGRVKMFEYLKNHYEMAIDPNRIPNMSVWHISDGLQNNGSFTIPVSVSRRPDRMSRKNEYMVRLNVVYGDENITDMFINCNPDECEDFYDEMKKKFGFEILGFGHDIRHMRPYDRELDNQAIIDFIDLVIDNAEEPALKKKA